MLIIIYLNNKNMLYGFEFINTISYCVYKVNNNNKVIRLRCNKVYVWYINSINNFQEKPSGKP